MKVLFVSIMSVFGAALCMILSVTAATATVSLRTGNFYVGYTDVTVPDGDMVVERVYNSKSPLLGWFGLGWGSLLETHLTFSENGNIVHHAYGSGKSTRLAPAGAGVWSAGAQTITKQDGKYIADLKWTGNSMAGREVFDDTGRLVRTYGEGTYLVDIMYGTDRHRPEKLTDSLGRSIVFGWNEKGFVEWVEGHDGRRATYKYNDRNWLIYSKDTDNNIYEYEYDARVNMTQIRYQDGTTYDIEYHDRALHENVKRTTDRKGIVTIFGYSEHSAPGTKTVVLELERRERGQLERKRFEWLFRGDTVKRLVTVIEGVATTTEFDEHYRPLQSERSGIISTFAYDDRGRIYEVINPVYSVRRTFDDRSRVVMVRRAILGTDYAEEIIFDYDDRGRINKITGGQDRASIAYTADERIKELASGTDRLLFQYFEAENSTLAGDGARGRVRTIVLNGADELGFIYEPNRISLQRVQSPQGDEVALRVTFVVQRFLDLVRLTGFSFSIRRCVLEGQLALATDIVGDFG